MPIDVSTARSPARVGSAFEHVAPARWASVVDMWRRDGFEVRDEFFMAAREAMDRGVEADGAVRVAIDHELITRAVAVFRRRTTCRERETRDLPERDLTLHERLRPPPGPRVPLGADLHLTELAFESRALVRRDVELLVAVTVGVSTVETGERGSRGQVERDVVELFADHGAIVGPLRVPQLDAADALAIHHL